MAQSLVLPAPLPLVGRDPAIALDDHSRAPGDLRAAFQAQGSAFARHPFPSAAERMDALRRLDDLVRFNADAIASAIDEDFAGRSRADTFLLDVLPSLDAISDARRNVKRWMRPARPWLSFLFQPASATVMPQPLGVVGIIVPWNVPLTLAIGPLVGALAAGNRVMLKMSEFTPRTGELFASLIQSHFDADHVTVVSGDADVAAAFSALPWDHLLFTGSTNVGKHVMRAAAENLTPVTLELGGKSPAIVDGDFPLETAARRILFGKCANAGQLCIAPDYALVPRPLVDDFVAAAGRAVARMYPDGVTSSDYTAIVNERHFRRLRGYLEDARDRGATEVRLAEDGSAGSHRMAPRVLLGVTDDMLVAREEIFGPILPVIPYDTLAGALAHVNERPRPLALYCFSHDGAVVDRITRETISGGVAVNDTLVHVGPTNLPFGGVGPSGMGHYHGKFGFDTFSKQKAVLRQSRFATTELMLPPYGARFAALRKLLARFV